MSIFEFRKFIFTNLFLFNLINFSCPVVSSPSYKYSPEVKNLKKPYFANFLSQGETTYDKTINDNLEFTKKKLSDGNLNKKFQLEIQSDKQYQQDSVLYAEGNVITNYKGNTLKADVLVYDKSKGI